MWDVIDKLVLYFHCHPGLVPVCHPPVCHPGLVPGSLTMRVRDPPDEPGDDNGVARLVSVCHPGLGPGSLTM